MRKLTIKILSLGTLCALALSFSACKDNNSADWEDTLPSASTRKSTDTVQVITVDTSKPISLDESALEKVTTVKTTTQGLATTTSNDDDDLDAPRVTAVPSVPITNYTVTTAVPITSPTNSTITTSEVSGSSLTSTSQNEVISRVDYDADSYKLSRPYSYNFLSPTQKYLYDMLINAMVNYKVDVKIPSDVVISAEDYKAVYELLYNDDIEIFYIGTQINYMLSSSVTSFTINYKYTQDQVKKMQKEIDYNTELILAKITDDMTEYDIVKMFFDEIASTCTYDLASPNCSDIYGCLVNKTAICGGFSKAFSYLCSKAGIESLLITGVYDEPHMWNMVKIDNEWYHIDVTAGIVNTKDSRYVRYDFFNVTDDFIKNGRSIYEQDYKYPEAIYNTYNYFTINDLTADSYDESVRIITEAITKATQTKETTVQFNCTSDEVYEIVYFNLFTRRTNNAITLLESINPMVQNKFNTNTITYNADPSTKVIKIFLVYKDN